MTIDPIYLAMAGKAAEGTASEAGKRMFGWLKGKLTGAAAEEALRDVVEDPED